LRKLFIISLLLLSFGSFAQQYYLRGVVLQKGADINLPGANILIVETNQGVFSDKDGLFSISVKEGEYTLKVSFIGYQPYEQKISINSNQNITINLEPSEHEIDELIVTDNRTKQNVENPQTGMVKLTLLDIKKLPIFLGDSDPIKAIRLTPGVQAGGEGNAGIFVRGGDPGQNLILLEDLPLYNPSHLLGLYSVFNPGITKNVTLYKGAYPSAYGGRSSSLMKIGLDDGISDKTECEGSLGYISSRIGIKTPLFNSHASLLLGGRITYLQVLQPIFKAINLKNNYLENNMYNFNDLNARLEILLNLKNRLIFNSFSGIDNYKLTHSTMGMTNTMRWGNQAASVKLIHLFNSDCSWSNTIGVTTYFFKLNASYLQYAIKLKSDLVDPFFRSDLLFSSSKNLLNIGIESTYHRITPESANVYIDQTEHYSNLTFKSGEFSLYLNDIYEFSSKISLIGGIRATTYIQLGNYNKYTKNTLGEISDTIHYGVNEPVKKYYGIEPRISINYKVSNSSSYKLSLSRTYQYIHLISVGTVSLPTDIWFPSTRLVKPEFTDQITLGYFRNFKNKGYEASVDLYFKRLSNVIEFKNSLISSYRYNEFEESITHGIGYSYGVEWYLKKNVGEFTGWLSYTLAWSVRKFKDINEGEFFFGKYDRRHDLALTLQYQINKNWSASSIFIYSTGNAMTLPAGRYMVQGSIVNDYTSVNSFRMPAYHRLDLSLTHTRKVRDNYESTWNFSIYNVYNRSNPYYIFFEAKGNLDDYELSVKAKKVSLFPILPSISWTFKF